MTAFQFPVESTHIAMFARAIADPNRLHSDAEHAATTEVGGIAAPPTFVQASAQFDPDYPLRPRFDQPWFGSGREATGVVRESAADGAGGGGLHAEQHYVYHRPMLAGDTLTVTSRSGEQWEKQGRRGGTLRFAETITEYRNPAGDLVVTARAISVRTSHVIGQD